MGLSQDADASLDWAGLREFACLLEPAKRTVVSRLWARAAQFEHASIASFDRFSLQLLAVGSPPDLIDAAHRAALDELRHARLCFAVASAYAGRALGPGPLVVDASAFADMTFPTVLALAIEEGCVGETLAAYEAQAALGCVTQPTLQHVLGVIARDEAEHAALAYRFARWGLTAGGSAARGIVDAAFHRAVTRAQDPSQEDDALQQLADEDQNADWLRVHGQRSSLARAQARRRALVEVIEPACRDLLRAAPASHPSSDRATR
ncbi:MAG: ferritin-like domain-containing protein [Sandaracinaceae bacterium]|nr:ferritin-like domain-containing protein [Myxococcales bacterium]MCB9658692.1 ferritin-like domain-containing protein [Sandaracinaceae bacterium]